MRTIVVRPTSWVCVYLFCFSFSVSAFSIKTPPALTPIPAATSPTAATAATAATAGSSSSNSTSSSTAAAAAATTTTSGGFTSVSGEYRGAQAISALTASTANPVIDADRIKTILPHRFPFLLVDKVLEFEPGKRAVGVKQVSNNEDQFNGHFPNRAVMPGVLQVEALAQLAGIVALQPPLSDGKGLFFFAGANGIKWKKPIVPGDTLVMEAELLTWKEKFGIAKFSGRGFVDGQLAVEVGEMTFAFGQS
ncbi:hypothetical protein ACSSS7_005113 [Eimeria intestinalis]